MGQGVSPEEAAARAGLTAGVELLNASGMADEALGAAVKKSGLLDTVVELGRKTPGGKKIVDAVEDRLDTQMFKTGMEMDGLNLTRAEENGLIELKEHLYGYIDDELGMIAKEYAQNIELTGSEKHDSLKSKFQFFSDSQQVSPNALNDGFLDNGKLTDVGEKGFLQAQYNYLWNGEKLFIPEGSVFEANLIIAGHGSETTLRVADQLAHLHGGQPEDWEKHVGQIRSDKYIFDIHWYERNGTQYNVKIKHRKER